MRFVVTGAGGFLGSNVVRELLMRTDYDVVAVTSQAVSAVSSRLGTSVRKPALIDLAELIEGDALDNGDVVVNCAFPWNRGGTAMASGLEFSTRLYRQASAASVRTFINVSSQSVYSQGRTTPADESSAVECDTPYSTAKYALELAAEAILAPGTLVNARMSSLVGPRYDIRIVNRFIRKILQHETLEISGGNQVFDFMDVTEAARALILIGRRGAMADESVLNVGASNPMTLTEIVEQVCSVVEAETGIRARISWGESQGDVRYLTLDCERLSREYGFSVDVPFEESVRRILVDLRAQDAPPHRSLE